MSELHQVSQSNRDLGPRSLHRSGYEHIRHGTTPRADRIMWFDQEQMAFLDECGFVCPNCFDRKPGSKVRFPSEEDA